MFNGLVVSEQTLARLGEVNLLNECLLSLGYVPCGSYLGERKKVRGELSTDL